MMRQPSEIEGAGALALYLEVERGVAGDMLLAALLGLLEPAEGKALVADLEALIPGVKIRHYPELRRSLRCQRVEVRCSEERTHRGLKDVVALIKSLNLPERVERRAIEVFEVLAAAEAAVHGCEVDQVHFHEVGALDSIVDIVGVCAGLERLGIRAIFSSEIALGQGQVETQHGLMPVPAPATLQLVEGLPTRSAGVRREVTTPTGAALLRVLAGGFGPLPSGRVHRSTLAAGSRQAAASEPINALRAILFEPAVRPSEEFEFETVAVLETHLDDIAGEDLGDLIPELLERGALDAFLVPTLGKKGRPASLVCALAHESQSDEIARAIFEATGTLGIRIRTENRQVLRRKSTEVEYRGQIVRLNWGFYGERIVHRKIEFEDLRRVARRLGLSLRQVRTEVERLASPPDPNS